MPSLVAREMTSEKRAQKFHTDDSSLPAATRLAQWDKRRSAEREVASSNPGRTNTQVLYITEEKVLPESNLQTVRLSTIMDKSLGTLLCFWGVFQFTQVQPLPSPHKQCWTRVCRIFFRVSTLYRVGGGRSVRKFRKWCTVLKGNGEMTEKFAYCCEVFWRLF